MCIYIYIYMYVCIYIYIYTNTYYIGRHSFLYVFMMGCVLLIYVQM